METTGADPDAAKKFLEVMTPNSEQILFLSPNNGIFTFWKISFCKKENILPSHKNNIKYEASAWSVENAINLYFTDPNMFNAPAAPPPQEQVRAPIAASFGTLAGPANPLYHGRQASTEPFRYFFSKKLFARCFLLRNYSQEWTRGSRQDERGLATLFSPPDYVFSGTLEQVIRFSE